MADRVADDYVTAGLQPQQVAMLRYAEKLTRTPAAVTRGDIHGLREAGFDDDAILAIAEVTAYFNYVNRLVDGLGVALEPGFDDG